MIDAPDRIAALEARLEQAEHALASAHANIATIASRAQAALDHAEIANLIAAYGPAVDNLDGDGAAALWAADGTYVIGDVVVERNDIAGVVDFDAHRAYVAAGCGHVLSPARIAITGDEAVAVNYSLVVMHEAERWVVDRMSANRWELVRTDSGWRVTRRVNRMLAGDEAARALLASA